LGFNDLKKEDFFFFLLDRRLPWNIRDVFGITLSLIFWLSFYKFTIKSVGLTCEYLLYGDGQEIHIRRRMRTNISLYNKIYVWFHSLAHFRTRDVQIHHWISHRFNNGFAKEMCKKITPNTSHIIINVITWIIIKHITG
jgi:hypothetical protein